MRDILATSTVITQYILKYEYASSIPRHSTTQCDSQPSQGIWMETPKHAFTIENQVLVQNSIRDLVSPALVRFKGCGDVLAWALDDHLGNASSVLGAWHVIGLVLIYRAGMHLSCRWCLRISGASW